jgi:hypothetical protein
MRLIYSVHSFMFVIMTLSMNQSVVVSFSFTVLPESYWHRVMSEKEQLNIIAQHAYNWKNAIFSSIVRSATDNNHHSHLSFLHVEGRFTSHLKYREGALFTTSESK